MAQGPGRAGAYVHHVLVGGAAAADGQVAHPLAGDGQGLGVGVADQGVVVEVHEIGNLHAVVAELPVGLVGEQEDRMAELLLGGLHGVGEAPDGLPGVDDAGGVVGGVEDHHPGLLGQGGLEGGQVDLEGVGQRLDNDGLGSVGLGVDQVFHIVGREDDDLVAGLGQALEGHGDGAGGAGGDIDARRLNVLAKAAVDGGGDGLPQGHQARGRGVAVDGHGVGVLQKVQHGGMDLRRRGHVGAADGEVEDVLRADFRLPGPGVGREVADDVGLAPVVDQILGKHGDSSFYLERCSFNNSMASA